jgi:hypothetical protein
MNLITKMRRKIKFEVDQKSEWHAVIPDWMGERYDLKIANGAEEFFGILSEGERSFYLDVSDDKIPGAEELIFLMRDGKEMESAWYFLASYKGIDYNMKILLSEITEFVFGEFPQRIYFYRETIF